MPATPPERMNRKPLWLAKIINSIRDFAVQSRITSIMVVPGELNKPAAEMTETPSGTLVKLRIGGAGTTTTSSDRPFALLDSSGDIRVIYSTLEGEAPDGFSDGDDPPYVLEIPDGLDDGKVWVGVTLDLVTFEVTSRFLDIGATVPENDPLTGEYFGELGSFSITDDVLSLTNAGHGPVTLCRDWFSFPIDYTFEFTN